MSHPEIQIKKTADGSNTLYLPGLDETYHSLNGALSESWHVYIKNGLQKQVEAGLSSISILEVGFGTGMNALLSLQWLPSNIQCHYISLEPYPLSEALLQAYYNDFHQLPDSFQYLPDLLKAQNSPMVVRPGFDIQVLPMTLDEFYDTQDVTKPQFDLIFFDAFAPSRQPELWTLSSLGKVNNMMKSGALLTTYCAQGQFKRHLKALGLHTEHPQGANGKREMTLAFKI